MRLIRIAVLLTLLSLPFVLTSGANALDLCEEPHCQPPPAEQNTPYEFEFQAEEGCVPYRFSYLNGTVPPGLQITQDGKLTGTPTEAGRFEFWVGLDDASGPQNVNCQIPSTQSQARFVLEVMPDLAVTTESLPLARPGQPYSVQLRFSNPEAGWPVIWSITDGSLPQGLSLSEAGVISGTPAGPDAKQFVVRAREPFRRFGDRQLTLTVAAALQASSAVRGGEVGVRYGGAIRATGGLAPLVFAASSGALPGGLTLNPATGAISGIPRAAGVFELTVAVTDAAGQHATVPTSIRIAARLAIETTRLPRAIPGRSYSTKLRVSGGMQPVRWSIVRGRLPRGIRLDRSTGALAGVPRQPGAYRFTVQGTDRLGGTSRRALRLVVAV